MKISNIEFTTFCDDFTCFDFLLASFSSLKGSARMQL